MTTWMRKLAHHYDKTRKLCPDERLLVLFDIDGTMLDMRHTILHTLKTFDQSQGTALFTHLTVTDITVHENQVDRLLTDLSLPPATIERVLRWYGSQRWTSPAIMESHRPYPGVMEVIRWFQIHTDTYVGINTGRPESLRAETLRCLNQLGSEYKVTFANHLLHMNPHGWNERVPETKAAGVRRFQRAGYRVFAFVDNEPENLNAVSKLTSAKNCLLLHADTIFETTRQSLPYTSVSGTSYDLTELIPEQCLPRHVQFVWAGLNDVANLRQFIASNVQCAECDVRLDPTGQEVILRHDSFDATPLQEEEWVLSLDEVLHDITPAGKKLTLHLQEEGPLIDALASCLRAHHLSDSMLRFSASLDLIKKGGFRRLVEMFPAAIRQCAIEFLAPSLLHAPEEAHAILTTLSQWGINRFSFGWGTVELRRILDQMDEFGFDVNIYNVPDLEAFLRAVLLQPKSVTSDFNFPKWHLFGRGAGKGQHFYEYTLQDSLVAHPAIRPHSLLLHKEGSGDA